MFDFDGLEAEVPSSAAGVGPGVLKRVAQGLQSAAWHLRRDACKDVVRLGLGRAATPLRPALRRLADADEDYEVRQAARLAVESVGDDACPAAAPARADAAASSSGAPRAERTPARASAPTATSDVARASSGVARAWAPTATFDVCGELLTMRLERAAMTPAEICHVWEESWGVAYASRIRFLSEPGAPEKWLSHREAIVPRAPFVVKLDASSGSVLESLRLAWKAYGGLSKEEAEEERRRRLAARRSSGEERARGGGPSAAPTQELSGRAPRSRAGRPWREGGPLMADADPAPCDAAAGADLPTLAELQADGGAQAADAGRRHRMLAAWERSRRKPRS